MANANKTRRSFPVQSTGVAPFLGWLPRPLWAMAKDFFIYSAEFLPIPAGGTVSFDTAIQSDSDFLAVAMTRVVTSVDNLTLVSGPVPQLVTVFDAGSGRQIFDRPQHMDNLAGTAQLPSYWPMPKIFRASATITTTVQNLDGANDRNTRIAYLGFKIFDFPAS